MKTTATRNTVKTALENVNKEHGYKLTFNRDEVKGDRFFFTIRSEKSGIPGARTSWSGRNMVSASWHAHGYLFDEIFKLEPDAVIWSGSQKITKDFGNWVDRNIGSRVDPCMYSETSIL